MGIERKNSETTGPGPAPYEDKVIGTGRATLRLRLYFLAPLTAVIMAAVGVSIADLYHHEHTDIQQGVVRVRASAVELYENSVRDSARALRTLMQLLGRDETLRAALARRAISTFDSTMARDGAFAAQPVTKPRSILSSVKGALSNGV